MPKHLERRFGGNSGLAGKKLAMTPRFTEIFYRRGFGG